MPTNGPAVARRPRPITDAIEPEPFCDRVPGPFPEGPARGRCVPVSPSSLKEKKKENKSTFKAWREKKNNPTLALLQGPYATRTEFYRVFFRCLYKRSNQRMHPALIEIPVQLGEKKLNKKPLPTIVSKMNLNRKPIRRIEKKIDENRQ